MHLINYTNGEIYIRVYKLKEFEQDYAIVRMEIIDTGNGIPYTARNSIFQRFYRIEDEIHNVSGTGLGLSIVRSILNRYNTKLYLNSRIKLEVFFGLIYLFNDLGHLGLEPRTIRLKAEYSAIELVTRKEYTNTLIILHYKSPLSK